MCKDANEKEEQKIKMGDLEYNLNHFFRYVYGGFILCLIIVLMLPKQPQEKYTGNIYKEIYSSSFYLSLSALVYILFINLLLVNG